MTRNTAIWVITLSGVLIAYSVYTFLQNHAYIEQTINTGLRGEARSNPLFASRLFLKRMGIPARSVNPGNTGQLPDRDTVIVIQSNRANLSGQRSLQLLDWVKMGGHLIVRAGAHSELNESETSDASYKKNGTNDHPAPGDRDEQRTGYDPLLAELGIYRSSRLISVKSASNRRDASTVNPGKKSPETKQAWHDGRDEDMDNEENHTHRLVLRGASGHPRIDLQRFYPLYLDSNQRDRRETEKIKVAADTFIIRQRLGRGMVSVLADTAFMENRQLAKADHAELLWYLVKGLHPEPTLPREVWLVHSDTMPALWELIREHFAALLATLTLLLLAWLMRVSRRFGPLIEKPVAERRSLMEHIRSSGDFYWQNKQQERLIQSTREDLLLQLSRYRPGWRQLNTEKQLVWVTDKTGISGEAARQCLFGSVPGTADEFIAVVKNLEKIRHSLT